MTAEPPYPCLPDEPPRAPELTEDIDFAFEFFESTEKDNSDNQPGAFEVLGVPPSTAKLTAFPLFARNTTMSKKKPLITINYAEVLEKYKDKITTHESERNAHGKLEHPAVAPFSWEEQNQLEVRNTLTGFVDLSVFSVESNVELIDDLFKEFEALKIIHFSHHGFSGHRGIVCYLAESKMFISIKSNTPTLLTCYWKSTPEIIPVLKKVTGILEKYKHVKPDEPTVDVMYQSPGGLDSQTTIIKRTYFDFYPEELKAVVPKLEDDEGGAYIFHGPPGVGKSSFIGLLTQKVKDKKFYVVPGQIAQDLDSPGFMGFMLERPNSIFILEDCEKLLVSRKGGGNGSLAALLNLSDGLVGSALNHKFILTFNCDLKEIDEAVLRSGRLKYYKEFKLLSRAEAKKIAEEYKLILASDKAEYSIAEIFNGDAVHKVKDKAVGFKV